MTEDPELRKARLIFNKAQRVYQRQPSEATKTAMKVANSAYRYAKLKAGIPPGDAPAPPPDEHPSVTQAREKSNAARRAVYANPGPELRKAWLEAKAEFQRLRRLHDPDYRKKMIAASTRSRARGKLGLTRKVSD